MAHIWERGAPLDRAKGLELLSRGCEGEDPNSCVLLAEVLMPNNEYGIEPDLDRATSILTESCGSLGGSPCLGVFGLQTSGVVPVTEDEGSGALLRRACSTGSGKACFWLASYSRLQLSDEAAAAELYEQACDLDMGKACHDRAWQHITPTIENPNRQEALTFMARSCGLGDGAACDLLAMTNDGLTIQVPGWEAANLEIDAYLEINRRYCGYGGGESCFNLAYNVARLQGETDSTAEEIVVSMQSACNQGSMGGCNILGHMATDFVGRCTELQDSTEAPTEAEATVVISEESEVVTRVVCAFKGFMYLYGTRYPPQSGSAIAPDREEALKALQMSCDAGSETVCARLVEIQREP